MQETNVWKATIYSHDMQQIHCSLYWKAILWSIYVTTCYHWFSRENALITICCDMECLIKMFIIFVPMWFLFGFHDLNLILFCSIKICLKLKQSGKAWYCKLAMIYWKCLIMFSFLSPRPPNSWLFPISFNTEQQQQLLLASRAYNYSFG